MKHADKIAHPAGGFLEHRKFDEISYEKRKKGVGPSGPAPFIQFLHPDNQSLFLSDPLPSMPVDILSG